MMDNNSSDTNYLSNQQTNSESIKDAPNDKHKPTHTQHFQEQNISKMFNTTSHQPPASESVNADFIVALRPQKALHKLPLRRNAENLTLAQSPHSHQPLTFSTGDGYNWRKYGQKLVKGNTFVRSYYKCTFATCPARKQVERTNDGNITQINYLSKHQHPQPLVKGSDFVPPVQSEDHSSMLPATSHHQEVSETKLNQPVVVPVSESKVEAAVKANETKCEINNGMSSDSKRQKRETCSVDEVISTKINCEPRVVVQTTSVVDVVNDGYRWRKYGQKLVIGNHNPRSYYRCTNAGCVAKKHVERASHDEKVVITTYEGRHDHDMPAGAGIRPFTQSISGTGSGIETDGSRPQPESGGMDMVLHASAT